MGYRPRQSSDVTKDAASAAQTIGTLFWKALSASFEAGEPIQHSDVKGAGLYIISPYWLPPSLFLMSGTKNVW